LFFLVDERVLMRYPDFKPTPLSWFDKKKPTEKNNQNGKLRTISIM
jgi:hypothetical protein